MINGEENKEFVDLLSAITSMQQPDPKYPVANLYRIDNEKAVDIDELVAANIKGLLLQETLSKEQLQLLDQLLPYSQFLLSRS